jgi:hypothetical protein
VILTSVIDHAAGGGGAGEDDWPEDEFSDGAWGEDFDGGHDDYDDYDADDDDYGERGSGSGSGRGGYHGDPFDFFDSVGHGDDDYDDDGDDGDDYLDGMLGDDDYDDEDEDGGWGDEDDDEDDFNPWKMLSKVRGPFGSIHHLIPAFQHPALGYGLPGGGGGGGGDGGGGGHFTMPTHFGGRRRLLSDGKGVASLTGRRWRSSSRQAQRDGECLNSTLHVNGASLDTTLPPGEYKLWVSSMLGPAGLLLEEREPPGGGCIPVSLAVSVSYEDPQPSPSTCTGRTVPASFDEAGYMSNGRMHVQAQYSVYSVSAERRHAISLTVSEESVIRVHVQGRGHVDMRLALFRDEGAGKAFMVDSEAPLVSDGVRGDSLRELTYPLPHL